MPIDSEALGTCCTLSLIALLFGSWLIYEGGKRLLLSQRIKNTPTSKARSAAAGLVELAGKAERAGELVSPITKKPCACWKILAECYKRGRKGGVWVRFYSDESGEPFFLEDETGRILVDPKGAELDMYVDFKFEGHLKDRTFFGLIPTKQIDKQVLAYLKENPRAEQAFREQGGKLIRLKEFFLGVGDTVYVLGTAVPKEGASSALAEENLIVKKGDYEKILYISDSSEKDVLGIMDISSWVALIGGLIIMIVTLMTFIMNIV